MASKLFNSEDNYGVITKLLHWVVALLIIGMLALGFIMEDMKGMEKLKYYGIHKAIGIIVLMLVVLRFGWRQMNYQPQIPESSKSKVAPVMFKLMEFAAKASHAMLYLLMFAMPLSGWLMTSAYGFPVSVFGWFTMPNPIAADKEMAVFLREAHGWIAYGLIGLIAAHIGAALFHHFYLKDIVMKRMLPALLFVMVATASVAAVPEFNVDKAKSYLKFEAVQNGAPVTGEFKNFSVKLNFDPKNLTESKVVVEVNISSISSTYDEMTESLKSAEWFDAGKFPLAKFESAGITHVEGDKYKANGKLIIRDKTVDAVLDFVIKKYDGKQAIAEGSTTISRNAFGVGQGEWKDTGAVKDDVKISFYIDAAVK